MPYARNARTHSPAQVKQLAASIREFGFTNPVLVDSDGGVIAGHGRLAAARSLGLDEVPVIELAHLNEAQKRAYVLADNQLAASAGWDDELLALELGALAEVGFDLTLTGFSEDELAPLLGPTEHEIATATITRLDVSHVEDEFWISVRGPLAAQADVLLRLRTVMNDYPAVAVDMGVTQRDGR